MFALAFLSVLGGIVAGIALIAHTYEPGCDGWVGCGTDHPFVVAGIACIGGSLLLAAIFGALGLIARSVGEMQAAQLDQTLAREPDLRD